MTREGKAMGVRAVSTHRENAWSDCEWFRDTHEQGGVPVTEVQADNGHTGGTTATCDCVGARGVWHSECLVKPTVPVGDRPFGRHRTMRSVMSRLALLLCCLHMSCWGVELTPLEFFKAFSAGSVPVEELLVRVEWNSEQEDESYFLYFRAQSNAMLFARSEEPFGPAMPSGMRTGFAYSQYENVGWFRYGGQLYEWQKGAGPEDNAVAYARRVAETGDLARLVNMGCDVLPAFGLRWDGESFVGTNSDSGFVVSGRLVLDQGGIPQTMIVHVMKPGSSNIQAICWFEYEHGGSAPVYPRSITKYVSFEGRPRTAMWRMQTLSFKPATSKMGLAQFSLALSTNFIRDRYIVTNGGLLVAGDGKTNIVPDPYSERERARSAQVAVGGGAGVVRSMVLGGTILVTIGFFVLALRKGGFFGKK